jgi:DNA-binding CsgD family transcriptional regulator
MNSRKTPLKMRGRWTRPEIQKLQRLYGSHSNQQVARFLGRSVASIERQAELYRLAKDKVFVKGQLGKGVYQMPRWLPEELKLLRRIYKNLSNLEVARRIGRSVSSVVAQANKLGLYKSAHRLEGMGRENIRGRWQSNSRAGR